MSSLARAVASRGALFRGAVKQHYPVLQLRSQGVGGSSHARLMSVGRMARRSAQGASMAASRRSRGNGLLSAAARGGGGLVGRAERYNSRHQSRSLGLFSGGPSNEVLRMLEQEAASAPADANAEVCILLRVCLSCAGCFGESEKNGREGSVREDSVLSLLSCDGGIVCPVHYCYY